MNFFVPLLLIALACSSIGTQLYTPLDSFSKQYVLHWSFNKSNEMLYFDLSLRNFKPTNFFVIGFSNEGSISNGHLCILWKGSVEEHAVKFQSISTSNEGIVTTDNSTTCDITDIKATPEEFRIMFHRHFNTSKPLEYVIDASDGTTHILYATGPLESNEFNGLNLNNYTTGVAYAQLIRPIQPQIPLPPDTIQVDMLNNNYTVPGDIDVICRLLKFPEIFHKKQHVIHIEPIIDPRNEQYVHHMGLWHCPISPDIELPPYNGPCYGSTSEEQPIISKVCNDKIVLSTPPYLNMTLPPGVGLPVGGEDYSMYVILTVHYFRPQKQDIVDNSGFRLYVTNIPQPYEASIITAQVKLQTPVPFLPPQQELFTVRGEIHSETTLELFPPQGINIFAVRFHAHIYGREMAAYHYRNGQLVDVISVDKHYDVQYQYERQVEPLINVLQGDSIRYDCGYNTMKSTNVTFLDLLNTDEMCIAFLFYYPRINAGDCNDDYDLEETRNEIAKLYQGNKKFSDFRDLIQATEWDNQTAQKAQNIFNVAKRIGSCDPKKHDSSSEQTLSHASHSNKMEMCNTVRNDHAHNKNATPHSQDGTSTASQIFSTFTILTFSLLILFVKS